MVEIAASSAAYDLHDKRRVYARNGVQEYLAVQMYEQRLDWFIPSPSLDNHQEPDRHLEGTMTKRKYTVRVPLRNDRSHAR